MVVNERLVAPARPYMDRYRAALRQLIRIGSLGKMRAAGLALLGASFVIGCLPIYLNTYSDEGDKLAIGLLMTRGSVLYRDVFTHHFPFTYYWAVAAFTLLGPTVLAARLSLLFLQVVVFAVLMRMTRLFLPLGLAALGWSATRNIYLGHMLLYTSLNALALAVVFVVVLVSLFQPSARSQWWWVVLGVFAALALLTDLSAAAPVALALITLSLSRGGWRRALVAGAVAGLIVAGYGAYLLLSGTLGYFYRDVILFNNQIYSKYTGLTWQSYIVPALSAVPTGLDILRPSNWMKPESLSPYTAFGPVRQWLFGGFLERLAFIAAAAAFLFQKKVRAALFVYLYGASLMVRVWEYFHGAPFALAAILAGAIFLARTWSSPQSLRARLAARRGQSASGQPGPVSPWWRWDVRAWAPLALAAELAAWPILLGAVLLVQHFGSYSYAYTFQPYQELSAQIRADSCGREVALGYYPGDSTVYFFTGLRPVSKYVFMWPWVAEVAMPSLLSSLSQGENLVQFQPIAAVFGYKTSVYLGPLQTYLNDHYTRSGQSYISPALAAHCPPAAPP